MKKTFLFIFILSTVLICGCQPKMNLFPDGTDPLLEKTLQGEGSDKVLVISISGTISDQAKKGLFGAAPSLVQEVTSRLKLAEKDDQIKGLVLKINSPGGTVTASDILYNEIMRFKKKTGASVVVSMMDLAASGGYYVSLAADRIMAHPTSLTGSVGVIFVRPKVGGLLDKIGVSVEVSKSGRNKDMGFPFKADTNEQKKIINSIVGDYAARFHGLVRKHRSISESDLEKVFTAQIYSAAGAEKAGLIDGVGYLPDAVDMVCELAGIPENSKVITYKRKSYPNDTLYNSASSQVASPAVINIDTGNLLPPSAGFYYLWLPAAQ
ncbi:signal peptide peptidase SppA [Maridesulfovibrio hydrothermalis]|uniref:Signal peptide peptidase SppA, 36K type n=1 Tax=Maridesulfovibrio hydrothermalis AM13 = DSM 14728 TaxID=1121451 RepID=L0R8C2_9BACT|nr:signal peptide peptidase SppA [Maridesulfovibrio hydrothermalis]CCO22994.1 Signal peptide peptidase SppA, 36K type [Maridesulfovibrio hydrothermalis AM13 = DSM 14728]